MFEWKTLMGSFMAFMACGLLSCSPGAAHDRSKFKETESYDVVEGKKSGGGKSTEASEKSYLADKREKSVYPRLMIKSGAKEVVEVTGPLDKAVVTEPVSGCVSGKDLGFGEALFVDKTVNSEEPKRKVKLTSFPLFLESGRPAGGVTDPEDSPFGISGIDGYSPLLRELGVFWVRYMGAAGIVWDAVEPQPGVFYWHRNDRIYSETFNNGVRMVVTILTPNRWDQGMRYGRPRHMFPAHVERYKEFLRRLVERYDGDGIDDAPGSPVVNHWQIENEGDFFWEDSTENYARLVKTSYSVIKGANPNAKVLLSGVATPKGFYSFYVPVLEHLKRIRDKPADRYFDIFDFHWVMGGSGRYRRAPFPGAGIADLKECLESIRNTLKEYGHNVPIWMTETASHTGMPRRGLRVPYETERQQAAELIKRMVYPLSLGVKKIFWSTLVEMHGFGDQTGNNDYFDLIGLVHNPYNAGLSHRKLSFYAYKALIDKLQGIDLKNVESLSKEGENHVYGFSDGNRYVYVLWRF